MKHATADDDDDDDVRVRSRTDGEGGGVMIRVPKTMRNHARTAVAWSLVSPSFVYSVDVSRKKVAKNNRCTVPRYRRNAIDPISNAYNIMRLENKIIKYIFSRSRE
jgi:hypothetical protein